ncbi:Cx9C motif-containing protein 4, mitochondrial [Fusarium sp. Ph1]|nr:Cx9C motif-containing protein 4, mitochondrial [Fusarium sp. Ph1]
MLQQHLHFHPNSHAKYHIAYQDKQQWLPKTTLRLSLPVILAHAQFKASISPGHNNVVANMQPDCLTRNGYNEDKCQAVIRQLYECCEVFYERYGEEASTVSCPKPYLLKLKMEQLREEGK